MLIIPAILEKESENALLQIERLRGVVPWIQIDLADGTMTESKTFDLHDLVGELEGFEVEVHLMTTEPEKYFDACAAIGATRVFFHLGEVESPSEVLRAMDPYDFTKGIALSPQTGIEDLFTYIDEIDAVQVMTVMPGKQGGAFLEEMLNKIVDIRERRTELWISVDGGINEKTITTVVHKSLDAAGVGSAIATAEDPVEAIRTLALIMEEEHKEQTNEK